MKKKMVILLGSVALMTSTFCGCGSSNRERDAWVCAQNVVKEKLKSPSTADFCSYPDASITDMGDDRYKVEGYVDAENLFGAEIRTDFTVTLTLTKNGYKDESCEIDNLTEDTSSDTGFHYCIVDKCTEYGANKITGISGETEYYCEKHYKEMEDMAEEMESGSKEQESDKVYQAYTAAVNLTKDQLTKTSKGYSYNGLDLLSEDCEWIDSKLNKEGTVNQGAVYRKLAKLLQGFEMKFADYTDFSEMLIGFIPEARDDFITYAENAMNFITEENDIQNIMKKFESLDCVDGSFDYEYGKLGKYSFEINDLEKCAEEMQISEEMLGYIFALLDEYAPKIEFNDNKCLFIYGGIEGGSSIKELSEADFVAKYDGEKHDISKILDENGEGYFQYFAFDATVDDSKKGIVKTHRGICIGNTKKEVIQKYGKADEFMVDLEGDELYQTFLYEGYVLADLMKNQCHSYIEYIYSDKCIRFYFDDSSEVSWIVFSN